ncbi:MAG: DNA mismatch repair protein MutS, partial [Ferruginibacter sp.]
ELNELENKFEKIKNYHVTNKEQGNKIIFLRKLAPGGSTHSFGIHVARMAGMPPELINRANEILAILEKKNESAENVKTTGSISNSLKTMSAPQVQLSIFDAHSATFEEIRTLLDAVDINRLTPVEALLKLQEIKSKIH